MKDLPIISVIVPYYNAGAQITSLLEAMCEQSYAQELFEVILVNNSSNDETFDLIRSYLRSTNNVRFHLVDENEKIGSYAARNKGISVAKGQILAFTDADCTPQTDWIEQGVSALRENRSFIVGGKVELEPRDRDKPTPAELFDLAYGFHQQANIEKKGFSVTANLFAMREAFEVVGPFNENLKSKGDYEWCNRATSHGYSVSYQPSCIVKHPARRKMSELVAKTRRIAGGQHDIGIPSSNLAQDSPSLPFRLVQQVKFVFSNEQIDSIRKKCCVVGVGFVLILVKYLEKIRLALGSESRRS